MLEVQNQDVYKAMLPLKQAGENAPFLLPSFWWFVSKPGCLSASVICPQWHSVYMSLCPLHLRIPVTLDGGPILYQLTSTLTSYIGATSGSMIPLGKRQIMHTYYIHVYKFVRVSSEGFRKY
jgi:hypothetical protein